MKLCSIAVLLVALVGCSKGGSDAGTLSSGGRVVVEVTKKGYKPTAWRAHAGDALTLVITRTEDTECGRYVKVPGVEGQTELPIGQPVEIPMTMPSDGELVFTCGMGMMRGVVTVAN
jgi:plastocyanin domain-containing protein